MNKPMIVYKTTNLVNGKIYIGQSSKNRPNYLGSGKYILRAIKKYGKENFKKEVMAWCYTREHLDFLEQLYIDIFNTKVPNGYNLTSGGERGFNHSEESIQKMKIKLKGKVSWCKGLTKETDERIKKSGINLSNAKKGKKQGPQSQETIRKRVETMKVRGTSMKGKKRSPESIKKQIETRKINGKPPPMKDKKQSLEWVEKRVSHIRGKKQSQEHIQKRLKKRIGVPLSLQTRQKIAETLTGRIQSLESNAKRSATLHGKTFSDETNKKRAEAIKRWHDSRKEIRNSPEAKEKRSEAAKKGWINMREKKRR